MRAYTERANRSAASCNDGQSAPAMWPAGVRRKIEELLEELGHSAAKAGERIAAVELAVGSDDAHVIGGREDDHLPHFGIEQPDLLRRGTRELFGWRSPSTASRRAPPPRRRARPRASPRRRSRWARAPCGRWRRPARGGRVGRARASFLDRQPKHSSRDWTRSDARVSFRPSERCDRASKYFSSPEPSALDRARRDRAARPLRRSSGSRMRA